ncbi:hypothetical protein [Ferrimonas marina]|uniref:Uncharacterized protein n=1 Tax=Ferrimonas marina TaxID=299255 RepID=A0A1M5TPW4_9GAMM|nr:hypothetical protein [Ferrimonas marina]SHH52802.1 hypothetical protein SAMN02745129_2233 [Ferrimonas marina]
MTNKTELLQRVGLALYGKQWQTRLAEGLGLSDARRVRQWMAGERPIPEGVWADLENLLADRQQEIAETTKALRQR